jgi:RNA methyltransferase, TrmH family
MEPVRSHRNRRVIEAAGLHRARARKESGLTLLEGHHLLGEALGAGLSPDVLFALEHDARTHDLAVEQDLELVLVNYAALRRLSGTETPKGPVAVLAVPQGPGLTGSGVVVSWGVSDPGNVGNMIRTSAAFGWSFAYTDGTADPWSPKVLRAGAGGHFRIGVNHIAGIDEIVAAGYTTVALVVAGGDPLETLGSGRFALLVGEEGEGLPGSVISAAGLRATIPMPGGTESLNAAMASGIAVYALVKQSEQIPYQV